MQPKKGPGEEERREVKSAGIHTGRVLVGIDIWRIWGDDIIFKARYVR
jgi:hypothetical protein